MECASIKLEFVTFLAQQSIIADSDYVRTELPENRTLTKKTQLSHSVYLKLLIRANQLWTITII